MILTGLRKVTGLLHRYMVRKEGTSKKTVPDLHQGQGKYIVFNIIKLQNLDMFYKIRALYAQFKLRDFMRSKVNNSSNNTKQVFYWNGLLDPRGLAPAHHDIIEKLIAGSYHGLRLKKLVGHNVFSARINKRHRLLFTIITVNDQQFLMLIDEVLNHDYAKSRFLKPAVLKNYLELHGKPITGNTLASHFAAHNESELLLPKRKIGNENIQFRGLEFHNQKFIQLDSTQQDVTTQNSLPLILSGAPGSGKSCIALLILSQYVESGHDNQYPILYVTESKTLANCMQTAWQALPSAHNLAADAVQFKSYKQLIKSLTDVSDKTFVDKSHCTNWLGETHIKHYKNLPNQQSFSKDFYTNIDLMYQEFRIISGCSTIEAYINIGKKQSLFHGKKEQEWLFAAYKSYQEHLEQYKLIHPPFYPVAAQNQFKRIVVDEAQDLSHLQLQLLSDLACNKQICFCEDNRQSLTDNKAKITFLKGLLYSWGYKNNHVTLSSSWRCPEAIINVANTVSRLKSMATGNGEPNIVVPQEQIGKGTVKWLSALSEQKLAAMREAASSPDFAIITLAKYKKDVMALFKTPLVFTTEEIKGLEYKNILVYDLFDEPLFIVADKIIGEQSSSFNKKAGHRAKANEGNEELGPIFNSVYTAFTRSTDTLYILQKENRSLRNITKILKDAIPKQSNKIESQESCVDNHQWFEEAKTQLNLGNLDTARMIYLNKLGKTDDEFEEFKVLFVPANKADTAVKSNHTTNDCITANPKSNKIPGDINKLLKMVTEAKLRNFLQKCKENNKAKEYLFQIPLEDGACLFTTLFYPQYPINYIITCMSDPLFHHLFDEISIDVLCRPSGKEGNDSPLDNLCRTKSGVSLLSRILTEKPGLANSPLLAKAICRSSTIGTYAETSPLYWLAMMAEGKVILKFLLDTNPVLTESITFEELCRPMITELGKSTSPFYWLCLSPDGLAILGTLIAWNSELAGKFTVKELCLVPSTEFGPDRAPLQILYGTDEGRRILSILQFFNPQLGNLIGHLKNVAPGDQIPDEIIQLLENVKKTTLIQFFRKWTKDNKAREYLFHTPLQDGACLFTALIYSQKNVSSIITCMKMPEFYELFKGLTMDALCRPMGIMAGEYSDTAPLFWILVANGGTQMFETLLERNPELSEAISEEFLCHKLKDSNWGGLSVLYLLSSMVSTNSILKNLLVNNSNLAKCVSGSLLFQLRSLESHVTQNYPVIYWLSKCDAGLEVLDILFSSNPSLYESEFAVNILNTISNIGKKANVTVLYNLSQTIEGQRMLLDLFVKNQYLTKAPELGEALCRPLNKEAGNKANTSPLYWLASMEQGREILDLLFKEDTKLTESITVEALCRSLTSGPRMNASPLQWLSTCPDGIGVLKVLFVKNPQLSKSITAKELCLSSGKELTRNNSPLALLSETIRGREILTILINNNPKLTALIKWQCQKSSVSISGIFAMRGSEKTITNDNDVSSGMSTQNL